MAWSPGAQEGLDNLLNGILYNVTQQGSWGPGRHLSALPPREPVGEDIPGLSTGLQPGKRVASDITYPWTLVWVWILHWPLFFLNRKSLSSSKGGCYNIKIILVGSRKMLSDAHMLLVPRYWLCVFDLTSRPGQWEKSPSENCRWIKYWVMVSISCLIVLFILPFPLDFNVISSVISLSIFLNFCFS